MRALGDGPQRERFRGRYGREPCVAVFAPGRVNLIGEHTDYSGGLALATSVPQGVTALLAPAADDSLAVFSATFDATARVFGQAERSEGPFGAALAGVVRALAAAGVPSPGAVAWVDSTVPPGMGLSSSAAFNVALIEGLCHLAGRRLPAQAVIEVAREAEHLGTGVRCGALDPGAIVHARPGEAALLDFSTGSVERVPVALAGATWVVLDTGLPRTLAESGYNERRAACERAAATLGAADPRWSSLAGIGPEALEQALGLLPPDLRSTVRHVVSENERVRRFARLLREPAPDRGAVGALLDATHRSLSEDYRVSLPALDRLLDDVRGAGALGARVMGAGFGGACLVLWPGDAPPPDRALAPALAAHAERTGAQARLLALGSGLGQPVARREL